MSTAPDDRFLSALIDWVSGRDDVRVVIRTGSRARRDGSADALSDHDIELYTTNPGRYAGTDLWLRDLGIVAVNIELAGPYSNPAHLVFFTDGTKADFQIVPMSVLTELVDSGLDTLHQRGYQVLLDRDGLAAALPVPTGSAPTGRFPDRPTFVALCKEFWFEAAHIPRYLARGETWAARVRDWRTKELLGAMIEWHAIAKYGLAHDVWHSGARMRSWADPEVWQQVTGILSLTDPLEDARQTADLFSRLSHQVAERFGLPDPTEIARRIRPLLDRLPDIPGSGQ